MNNIQDVSIEKLQGKLLEILVYFKEFCDEHHLSFVLCGGTCLGAVRHQGFIPWDDDIDVFMLREDYEKLQPLWEQYADTTRYTCVRSNETLNIHHSATEVKDNNTTFINRHSVDEDFHHGLMIDIIPVDGVAPTAFGRVTQMIASMIYCCFNFQRLPNHKSKLIYYITKIALGVIRSPKLRYKLWKTAEQHVAKHGTEHCECVASFGEGTTIMRMHYPVEWFRNVEYLDFAGHPMPVPSDVHEFLRISFGDDYMQLPPEEDRVARHDVAFVDLDNSYTKYKGIHYCVKK